MALTETTLLPLLIILFFGLVGPELFRKLNIPYVSSLILIGAVLGPNWLGIVASNEVIEFLGFLGMTFLMFMAGIESDVTVIRKVRWKILVLAGLNGLIPFGLGVLIAQSFGYSLISSLLLGTIFVSSSVAVVIPALKASGLFNKTVGQTILASVLVLDVASLIALAIILQQVTPISGLPPIAFIIVVAISVIALFAITPVIARFFLTRGLAPKGQERRVRFLIILLIATVAFFSALGIHPILAAFMVGIPISAIVRSGPVFNKIHALGYGLFIPVFFFVMGMQMDLSIVAQLDTPNKLIWAVVIGLIASKYLSGFVAGKLVRLSSAEAGFFGIASTIQVTTTLAVTFAASTLGLFDSALVTAILIVSVITTIIGPILLKWLAPRGRTKTS